MTLDKHFIIVIPSLKIGGSERIATVLANYAIDRGYLVDIILMVSDKPFFPLNDGIVVHYPKFSKRNRFIYYVQIIRYLRYTILREGAKVVFALGYRDLVGMAMIGTNIKLIGSHRTSPGRKWTPLNGVPLHFVFRSVYKYFLKITRRRYQKIIVQTNYARDRLRNEYGKSTIIEAIPNFLRPLKDHLVEKRNQVICVGRLSKEKGQRFLIEAWSKILTPGWELVFVGDGPERSNLEELSLLFGLSNVRFVGYQEDVDYFMKQSRIFVLPSLVEGFPNALLEAMANGLACISFDCQTGPSELISDGVNGFLVKMYDVEELATRINALIVDPNLTNEFGEKALYVKTDFDLDKIGQKYLDFIFS